MLFICSKPSLKVEIKFQTMTYMASWHMPPISSAPLMSPAIILLAHSVPATLAISLSVQYPVITPALGLCTYKSRISNALSLCFSQSSESQGPFSSYLCITLHSKAVTGCLDSEETVQTFGWLSSSPPLGLSSVRAKKSSWITIFYIHSSIRISLLPYIVISYCFEYFEIRKASHEGMNRFYLY